MFFEFDDFDVRERFYTIEEKTERLKLFLESLSPEQQRGFRDMCVRAFIYHDSALDGLVVSGEELASSFGARDTIGYVRSRVMQEIMNHRDMVFTLEAKTEIKRSKTSAYQSEVVQHADVMELHRLLYQGISRKDPGQLRKVTPLHSAYFHELVDPKLVEKQLLDLCIQTEHPEFRAQHPINQAVLFHRQFMTIFPFLEGTGKVARMILNGFLLQGGYQLTIFHGSERQRYYETLRDGAEPLRDLLLDSMESGLDSQLKFVQQEDLLTPNRRAFARSSGLTPGI